MKVLSTIRSGLGLFRVNRTARGAFYAEGGTRRRGRSSNVRGCRSGQSLTEVALIVPLFTLALCYAVDVGYFYMVAASLTSAARSAGLYSIQGYSSSAGSSLPPAGPATTPMSVAALATGDLSSFAGASVNTSVYVCSDSIATPTHPERCASYNSAPVPASLDKDPESSMFAINRVDVYYTISPPIKLGGLLPTGFVPNSFHRFIEVRVLN